MSELGTETNPYGSFMTEPAVPEGTSARAGAKLVEGQQKAPDEAIVEALRTAVSYTHLTLPTILLV